MPAVCKVTFRRHCQDPSARLQISNRTRFRDRAVFACFWLSRQLQSRKRIRRLRSIRPPLLMRRRAAAVHRRHLLHPRSTSQNVKGQTVDTPSPARRPATSTVSVGSYRVGHDRRERNVHIRRCSFRHVSGDASRLLDRRARDEHQRVVRRDANVRHPRELRPSRRSMRCSGSRMPAFNDGRSRPALGRGRLDNGVDRGVCRDVPGLCRSR